MTLKSPFKVRSPVVLVELLQARHINDKFGFRRVAQRMILFGRPNDQVDHIRKATTAASTLRHGMINLARNDQLPAVLIEELNDRVPDIFVGDVIAATDQHSQSARKGEQRYLLFLKECVPVKKESMAPGHGMMICWLSQPGERGA
jgi:hypothetical protein